MFYCESSDRDNTQIVAMVKNPRILNTNANAITSFEKLKNRTACFPEYDGLSWLSFINFAHDKHLFKSKSCIPSRQVAEFFSGACTPGIRDSDHRIIKTNPKTSENLCSLCFSENKYFDTCSGNSDNMFYDDQGAFQCLKSKGDVAFVNLNNLLGKNSYFLN